MDLPDGVVSGGPSLQVRPEAALADMAKRLVVVNAQPTPYDAQADAVVRDPIGEVLPQVAASLT